MDLQLAQPIGEIGETDEPVLEPVLAEGAAKNASVSLITTFVGGLLESQRFLAFSSPMSQAFWAISPFLPYKDGVFCKLRRQISAEVAGFLQRANYSTPGPTRNTRFDKAMRHERRRLGKAAWRQYCPG
ncbi:MAG: hypothetical protein ACLQIQ_04055 [Beijerinckiaceae bacterium]